MQASLKELMALALDALPQAVLVADGNGAILVRNAAAEEMLAGGSDVAEILGGGSGAIDWAEKLSALAKETDRLEYRNVSLTGARSRHLLADICLCRLREPGEGGPERLTGVLVVVQDVSGRASMERRAAAGERRAAAGELAARVAHELNNPLDGVLRYIGLAERFAGSQAGGYLASARSGLVRMGEIIRNLVAPDRLWHLAGPGTTAEKLLQEAMTVMQPRAQSLNVVVICDVGADCSEPVEGKIFEVFCNVIKNALDAMPTGGVLNIRLRRMGQVCLVEFADTGCGFEASEAEKIFEPFYTTKPAGQGMGLGLAICREIMTTMGGSITASPHTGGGAVVAVKLPMGKAGCLTNSGQ